MARQPTPQCDVHHKAASLAYRDDGCRCRTCVNWQAKRRAPRHDPDPSIPAGPVEQGVIDDINAADLSHNPRRSQLIATARHLARLIDQQAVSSPASAARELNATTEALHATAHEAEDELDREVESYGRPSLVPAPIRDDETA